MGSKNNISVAFGGGAEFTPASISDMITWYDANDSDTITKDSNDFVSQWEDKSTEGNNLTQSTGTNQPKWIDSIQNGLPVIRFDGTDNYIDRSTYVNGALTQPTTFAAVYSMPTNTTGNEHHIISLPALN